MLCPSKDLAIESVLLPNAKWCTFIPFINCLWLRHEYSMTFLPIFGNLCKMGALDCGMIYFMNEKIKIP